MTKPHRKPRVAMVAAYYGDYSVSLALALHECFDLKLLIANHAIERDVTPAWWALAKSRLKLKAFASEAKKDWIPAFFRVLWELLRFRPDVIIGHEFGEWYYTPAMAIASWFRPVILIVHDPKPHAGWDAGHAQRRASRFALERRSAAAFAVHGAFCAQALAETGEVNGRPVISIAHGPILTDPTQSRPADYDGGELLMFGRMQAYKGLDVLLDAMEILKQRGLPQRLRLSGRGDALPPLKPRIAEIGGITIEEGFLTPKEASERIQAARVVIVPYLEATQSGVVAAALGNGCPVIATAVGSIPDTVVDEVNGILIQPGDATVLADAIQRFVTDADLRARLRHGVSSTRDNISWESVVRKLTPFIEQQVR